MRRSFLSFLFFSLIGFGLAGQITIHLASLPANTPAESTIYFAGNINGWDPGSADYFFNKQEDGDLWLDLPVGSGQVEFKFTRGSWETVESNGSGGYRPNRTYTYGNGDTLHLEILGWEDLDEGGGSFSTANEQVMIWQTDMWMPQLNRSRRIWVYLPIEYTESDKKYPVLYMHDGQNVFDAGTSFAGEWKVDETLTSMEENGFYGLIVVAIDNGGSHRIDEYSPFVNGQYGGGEGDQYLDFIISTLKPGIDSSFRTLSGPEYTGIMGSSMGGLISHYAHFRNPEVFGRAGIFSPSYWFSDDYFTYTENSGKTLNSKLYLLAGEKEASIASSTRQMNEKLIEMGYGSGELKMKIVPGGEHAEWFWAGELEEAISWLFPQESFDTPDHNSVPDITIYPNPAGDTIWIRGEGQMKISLFDPEGKLLGKFTLEDEGFIPLQPNKRMTQLIVMVEMEAGKVVRKILSF